MRLVTSYLNRSPARPVLVLVALLLATSCSSTGIRQGDNGGMRLEELAGSDFPREVVEITVPRDELKERFSKVHLRDSLRVVRVFRRGLTRPYPEYRLFDVRKGGPYDLLGLQSGDVVMAADGWIVFGSEKIVPYVGLLRYANEGSFTINRDGKVYELRISVEPSLDATTVGS